MDGFENSNVGYVLLYNDYTPHKSKLILSSSPCCSLYTNFIN